ncbi:MAG TPA: sigma-54 dependent transcriptional regulator, partial [Pirellulales bacterium]
MNEARVLIVDADAATRAEYAMMIDGVAPGGIETLFETDPAAARGWLVDGAVDALVVAARPPTAAAVELLTDARRRDSTLPVLVIADEATLSTIVTDSELNSVETLVSPLPPGALSATLGRLLAERRFGAERELLRRQIERPYSFDDILGACPAMRKVFETINQVAASGVDVLVVGETGTGKELVARSIHRRSRRAEGPFVPVDCGAIPENLLEAEFFGHEKGAFTGADNRSIGLLEFANGGTFFLDELGELPLLMQAKLLRTLQERRIRRVGGRQEIDVDVRIVAATGRDLDAMVAHDKFRKDLYYRINVVRIDLPPLSARGDDLGLLAEYFAVKYSREMQKPLAGITPEAYQVLSHYRWPGNVRELQNVIRRAIALSSGTMIGL